MLVQEWDVVMLKSAFALKRLMKIAADVFRLEPSALEEQIDCHPYFTFGYLVARYSHLPD